jgi:tripartite-type tricarboxylate transporter receptor subunit TctC
VLATDDIKKVLALDGAEPAGGTPAALAAYHKADYEKWGKVITTGKIKDN